MSEAEYRSANKSLMPSVAGGVLSGLLYGTVFLSLAFLVPLQVSYGRRGRKHGLVACLISLATALAFQVGEVLVAGGVSIFGKPSELALFAALAVLPPALLIAGLMLMNAPFWNSRNESVRGFVGAAPAVLAAIPGLVYLNRSGIFVEKSAALMQGFVDSVLAQAGKGVDAAAFKSAFDVQAIAGVSQVILNSAFAGFILILVAASWWIGNRVSGQDSPGRATASAMADYHLPFPLVWAFLSSWALVLVVSWFKIGLPFSALVWNLAIVVSLAYAAQGLGIVSHFLRRASMPRMLRFFFVATAVMLLVTPPLGTVFMAVLPILGVTEVWIPYRNPKGVGA